MADPTDPDADRPLDPDERAALDAWRAESPPVGFADRVLAAQTARAPVIAPPVRRTSRLAIAIAVAAGAATAAAVVLAMSSHAPDGQRATGATTVAERRSIPIGQRAMAVAERGAVLAWAVDEGGGARVEHGDGEVFYRVDRSAAPFVVATPLGEVRVTGTCFRVEVIMKKTSKQTWIGGAVGAALAAAVVVTVYEGGVVVAGRGGATKVGPGQHVTLTANGATLVAGGGPENAAPDPTATREQLLARDELQRQRIAGLSSRVNELEQKLGGGGGGDGGGGAGNGEMDESGLDHGRPWYDPSKEQLAEWVKSCQVRFDVPPISDSGPFVIPAAEAAEHGIAENEVAPLNQVFAELQRKWTERIRAIYVDVVGEGNAEAGLSAQAMMQEIEDKSPPGERAALQLRLAQERAGQATPPADWSHASPIERLVRSLAAIGDETEQAIAAKLGAARAHELRAEHGGWSSKRQWSGCDTGGAARSL